MILPREGSRNNPDLVQIFSKLGQGLHRLFTRNSENSARIQTPAVETEDLTDHNFSFGQVYANDLARAEITRENPQFPVGSIIVREKHKTPESTEPEIVIAMVKREAGFSRETNDWEFFALGGADLKLNKRETAGSCATCHIRAEKTDWVFRDYLK